MTKTEKLIFIADYIEPGRTIPGVDDIRDMAYNQGSSDKTIYEISQTHSTIFNTERYYGI